METFNISSELMSEICENAPPIIAYHDTQQRIVWANKAYRQAIGVSLEELCGQACYHLWGLERRCRDCPVTRAIATGESAEAEHAPVTQDEWPEDQGAWLVRAEPIRDENGRVVGAVESAFEITERKREEQERLEESEERYRGIFEQAGDGIFLMDRHGSIKDCNPSGCSMLGYRREELLNTRFTDLISSESLVEQPFAGDSLSKGEHVRVERELLCKSGSRRTMEESLVELHTGELLIMLRDITERKSTEEALQKSNEKFSKIFHKSPSFMLMTAFEDGTIIEVNDVYCELTGFAREELIGRTAVGLGIFDPEDRREGVRLLEEKGSFQNREERRWTRDGREQYVLLSAETINLEGRRYIISMGLDITERKRIEEKLDQRQRELQTLTDNIPDLVFRIDRQLRHVFVNQQVIDWTGIQLEQYLGRTNRELGHPPDLCNLWDSTFRKVFETLEPKEIEFTFETPRGCRNLFMRVVPEFSADGSVETVVGITHDYTERAEAENKRHLLHKELEDREALLHAIFENAPGGIVVCDDKARITMTNPAAEKLYNRPIPLGKEVGSHWELKILQEDDTPYDPRELPLSRSALRGEYCQHEEVRIQWPQGQKRWLLVNTAPILREEGGQSGAVGLIHDITKRKKSEQALRESEQRFRQLFEQAAIGIFIASRDFTIIEVNQAALSILGYSREEALHKSARDILHPEDLRRYPVETAANRVLSGGEVNIERRFRLKGGGYIHVLVSLARMPYYREKASYMVMFQDISDRKRMEEQLKQMSLYDSLTGLYNRTFFDLEMERLSDKRYMPVGIVVCDLDGLKFVNDTLGHSSGDEMIFNAASILRQCIRSSEIIARIGGDEFAILLPRIDEGSIYRFVQRLRRGTEEFNAKGTGIPVSLSIGYSVGSTGRTDMQALFRAADNLMYREKIQKEGSPRSAIVRGLTKAFEARDFVTDGHCDRIQKHAVSLAHAIGLPENRINDLRLFARFHDLGKVGIHDHILFKPETLTEDELREMRKHSEVGHRIAQSLPEMAFIADWILKHHERWDGLGYPFGLKGRDIPLECRILAIADAFDVMTSDRPYHTAMSQHEAVQELRRCAGTQFDPHLVELFIRILDQDAAEHIV